MEIRTERKNKSLDIFPLTPFICLNWDLSYIDLGTNLTNDWDKILQCKISSLSYIGFFALFATKDVFYYFYPVQGMCMYEGSSFHTKLCLT